MRHSTGRVVRTAIGSAAAIAALALPLLLGTAHASSSDGASSVLAGEALPADTNPASGRSAASDPEEPGEFKPPKPPKPEGPGDDTGSWVWDKENP